MSVNYTPSSVRLRAVTLKNGAPSRKQKTASNTRGSKATAEDSSAAMVVQSGSLSSMVAAPYSGRHLKPNRLLPK